MQDEMIQKLKAENVSLEKENRISVADSKVSSFTNFSLNSV